MGMFQNTGRALRLLREIRGISQAPLARMAGIGKSQLSKYENGREFPKFDSLDKILTALRVSPLGFFYTVHLIDQTALRVQEGEGARTIEALPLPDLGLLSPEVIADFHRVFTDLLDLYHRIHGDFLLQKVRDEKQNP